MKHNETQLTTLNETQQDLAFEGTSGKHQWTCQMLPCMTIMTTTIMTIRITTQDKDYNKSD